MSLRKRLERHEAAKCERCGGSGGPRHSCAGCNGEGWSRDDDGMFDGGSPPTHATVAALLRFAVAVEEADGFSQFRVMRSLVKNARLHLYRDLAASDVTRKPNEVEHEQIDDPA